MTVTNTVSRMIIVINATDEHRPTFYDVMAALACQLSDVAQMFLRLHVTRQSAMKSWGGEGGEYVKRNQLSKTNVNSSQHRQQNI